jgi:hypothetical protein
MVVGYLPFTKTGKVDVLQELSKHGVSMNEKDSYGNTPATRAACKGHVGVIRELVKHKDVDLNACDGLDSHSGFNSSTIAVVQGQVDMVAELSRQGVDLAARDGWGYTPAAWAATWGDVSTIRELAKQKVDLTSTCNTHFSSDWEVSPAAIAARAGHVPGAEGVGVVLMSDRTLHGARIILFLREEVVARTLLLSSQLLRQHTTAVAFQLIVCLLCVVSCVALCLLNCPRFFLLSSGGIAPTRDRSPEDGSIWGHGRRYWVGCQQSERGPIHGNARRMPDTE